MMSLVKWSEENRFSIFYYLMQELYNFEELSTRLKMKLICRIVPKDGTANALLCYAYFFLDYSKRST